MLTDLSFLWSDNIILQSIILNGCVYRTFGEIVYILTIRAQCLDTTTCFSIYVTLYFMHLNAIALASVHLVATFPYFIGCDIFEFHNFCSSRCLTFALICHEVQWILTSNIIIRKIILPCLMPLSDNKKYYI